MGTNIKQTNRGFAIWLLTTMFLGFMACNERITIDIADETPYETAIELQGYLKDAVSARTSIPLEIRGNMDINVLFGLTKATGVQTSALIAVDTTLVAAYNVENNTSYRTFPVGQTSVSDGGAVAIPKWHTESKALTISLTKGTLEESTYLLPIVVKNGDVTVPEKAKTLYYFVKIAGTIPDITKGDVKTLVYVEVNNGNPLNVGNYVLQDSRKPFFDMMVIFAANVQLNKETREIYLKYNENVDHLLKNREKYIKPLQDKGIKVLLGLLNDHAGVGIANLQGESLRRFAAQCKVAVETYGLDGVDLDDEWAEYGTVNTDILTPAEAWTQSGTKQGRLAIELRRLMPDKIITLFEYTNIPPYEIDGISMSDVVDYTMYSSYPGSNYYVSARTSYMGLPNARYSPAAVNLRTNDSAPMLDVILATWATFMKNSGYGFLFFYDLRMEDLTSKLSAASNVFYGEPVVMEREPYAKDW